MVKSLVIWVIRVPWQSKQNGAAVDVSAEIVSYSYFYWKKYDCNWVTKLRSRYYCNMSRIRPRLIRCHWSFDPRWVKISGHSEQLGPCGSTSHFVNNRHSKVKTRGASCIGGFGQTDGQRKFELGIPQSRGAPYIRGASYIRDKTVGISRPKLFGEDQKLKSWVIYKHLYCTSISIKICNSAEVWKFSQQSPLMFNQHCLQ